MQILKFFSIYCIYSFFKDKIYNIIDIFLFKNYEKMNFWAENANFIFTSFLDKIVIFYKNFIKIFF